MQATKLLSSQHRKVEALFKSLTKKGADSAATLDELADALCAHMLIEQEIFYPAVRAIAPALVLESFEEHSLAELALKRLLATHLDDPNFQARLTATKELIAHHVKEEEEDLFPKVEKKLGEARLTELGAKMKERFEEANKAGFKANVPGGYDSTSADASLEEMGTEAPAEASGRNGAVSHA
jgi:hemerythrin superfamily protein